MASTPVLVTKDSARARLVMRLREDLNKQAIILTHQTIEQVIDAYDKRRDK